jgi:hypothetical protein
MPDEVPPPVTVQVTIGGREISTSTVELANWYMQQYELNGWGTTSGGTLSGGTFSMTIYPTTYTTVSTNEPRVLTEAEQEHLEQQREIAEQQVREEQAQRDARQARWEMARQEERMQRQEAIRRSTELLESLLNDTQRESYCAHGHFDVVGSAGNIYRIEQGSNGNILWLVDGEVAGRLCAHPHFGDAGGWLPLPDVALGQMLALVTDERGFIDIANVHAGRRPEYPELEEVEADV